LNEKPYSDESFSQFNRMGIKELHISEELMLHLCSASTKSSSVRLPSDARVAGRVFNELTKVWELGIESAAFDGPPFMLTTPVITTLARGDVLANGPRAWAVPLHAM